MISAKMQDAINSQIQHEFYSAYLYLAMSGYFEGLNLEGFAKWLRVQSAEEQAHALKFFDYLFERGGKVELKALDKPPVAWGSPLEAFKEVFAHEQKVTSLIYKLYEVALAEKDYAAQVLLQWFISEQVEEEKNAADIIAGLERIEAHDTAVLMLDHQLGKRGG
jgi:ferritin